MVAVVPRAAHAFSVLALGWYASRFQRFCRFAASDMVAGDKAFYQSTFVLKSVTIICEQLLMHDPMAWTPGTGGTPSNDALTPGTGGGGSQKHTPWFAAVQRVLRPE